MKPWRIAIIGGGVSGTLTAIQLLRQTSQPLELILIERRSTLGLGVAYSTASRQHVLNVPARKMSALPDDPDHFLQWLAINAPQAYQPQDFVPRPLYGHYIQDLLATTLANSAAANSATSEGVAHKLTHISQLAVALKVTTATAPMAAVACQIQLADGQELTVDRVVLAWGNFLPTPPPLANAPAAEFYHSPFYVNNPWQPEALATLPRQAPVLLLGTGLTTIDLILSLIDQGHEGTIHVVSRRGLFPHSHRFNIAAHNTTLTVEQLPTSVRGLLHRVRGEVHQAMTKGTDWRAVIDALRPFSHDIWQRWDTTEQQRFLRHTQPYWDIHRHRVAPQVGEMIQKLLASGQVIRHVGRVYDYQWPNTATNADLAPVRVTLQPRDQGQRQIVQVAKVINGTGPEFDYRRLPDPLIQQLLQTGLITPTAIASGVQVAPNGALINHTGQPSNVLFTLGPPQKGVVWETTAVPEIREQAASLASYLLNSVTVAKPATY
jgi:uncharacterized NAD(P)/FAD-binding protein YdhS